MRQASEGGADIRGHTPAETFDLAAQRKAWLRHHIDGRTLPRRDPGEVRLAEIADRIPLLGVDDGEDRVPRARKLAGGNLECRDSAVAGCAYHRLLQVALRQRER